MGAVVLSGDSNELHPVFPRIPHPVDEFFAFEQFCTTIVDIINYRE